MTKSKNNIKYETMAFDDLTLDTATVKKLRASSSMFNKSVFVKIEKDFQKYNVESIHKNKKSMYTVMLISSTARLELRGEENTHPEIIKTAYI
jgi:hypothetical protein